MAKKRRKCEPEARRPKDLSDGQRTYRANGKKIVTHSVGALPIINHFLERMKLDEILTRHLPPEDERTKIPTSQVVLLVLKNFLVSREPMYGVAEWASNYGPELFDLWPEDLGSLNDDRIGRSMHLMFVALATNLVVDVVTHSVDEFQVGLDQLHNDSTTVTVSGEYPDAAMEQVLGGLVVPAITWGHNKDHRPDLKQLLYILTVSDDGGIPVYFQAESGNVVDDQTHLKTWKMMSQLAGRPDFVYVADCKLASTENMNEIARQGGRFITVLPATRKEDTQFRQRLLEAPAGVRWQDAYRLEDEDGSLRDMVRVCAEEHCSKEGYRLLWFHSQTKEDTDRATRARRVAQAIRQLTDLRERLTGPRTRFRQRKKVLEAVNAILDERGVRDLLRVEIKEQEHEKFRQASPGRPTKNTKYTRQVETRFDLTWEMEGKALERAAAGDGVFPLVTNLSDWTAEDVLKAYKRQPIIEKRFAQLKTDFRVAPVYLKSVTRIIGMLAIYFFALMVQALIERELRQAMKREGIDSLPLYPEGRPCTRPTTRQIIDLFAPISRHTIYTTGSDDFELFATELAPIHCTILRLLGVPRSAYEV